MSLLEISKQYLILGSTAPAITPDSRPSHPQLKAAKSSFESPSQCPRNPSTGGSGPRCSACKFPCYPRRRHVLHLTLPLSSGGIVIWGGPALVEAVRPTDEELFERYSPELKKRSLEGRQERQQEFDDFVTKLKEYSKSDKPSTLSLLMSRRAGDGGMRD